MSDETAMELNGDGNEAAQKKDSVTLSITQYFDGKVEFNMPIKNKILCYGLLEIARAQLDKIYLANEARAAQAQHNGRGIFNKIRGGK